MRKVTGGILGGLTGAVSLVLAGTIGGGPALASGAPETGSLVSAVPASYTPEVLGGNVDAITGVGPEMVIGGSFATGISQTRSSATIPQNYIFAMDATTGVISSAFAPVLNGSVETLVPGPTTGYGDPTVYVGGVFSTVNGQKSSHIVLLDLTNGMQVTSFRPPGLNGDVSTAVLTNGQLVIGGHFTTAGSQTVDGIASLNPSTGALTNYVSFGGVQGHHNWTPQCGCAKGAVGVTKIVASPNGTRMVVIGNFLVAGGAARNQVAMLDLSSSSATVDPNWATSLYSASCAAWAYDSYIRDVAFSPDGSYFAIVATGGGGAPQPNAEGCDSVARFETTSTGSSVAPTWADYTGNDTIFSVVIDNSAIYIGGHQRWLNNPYGSDYAASGAVPRPGLAAIDPSNGLPYSWNPGRNPRGVAVYAMYVSASGLWIGSNTQYIGNYQYYRARLAFFPYKGGETLPGATVPGLPGTVYLGGSSGLGERSFNPATDTVGPTSPVAGGSGVNWSLAHGAFMVNGSLYWLCAPASGVTCDSAGDEGLFTATFDGTTIGTPSFVQPFNDPYWKNVKTGSGGRTPDYVGLAPPLYNQAASVTGLTYSNGQIYYTLSGQSQLYNVAFEPEDGIVGASEWTVANTSNVFTGASGLFTSGGELYWANSAGQLEEIPFVGGAVSGPSTLVDSGNSWTAQALFLGPPAPSSGPPAFVQPVTSGRAKGVTSASFSVATASSTSNSVLVSISLGSPVGVASVTDTAGNAYQEVYGERAVSKSHPGVYLYEAYNARALAPGDRIAIGMTGRSSIAMQADEWSGLSPGSDASASGNGISSSVNLGPVTTTQPTDVVLGVVALFGSVSSNVSSGWSLQNVSGGPSLSTAWQLESAPGSYGPKLSWPATRNYAWYEIAIS